MKIFQQKNILLFLGFVLLVSCKQNDENYPQLLLDSYAEKLDMARQLISKNLDSAYILLEETKDILHSNDNCNKALYMNVKARYFWRLQNYDSALKYSCSTPSLVMEKDCKEQICESYLLTGIFFYYKTEIDSALKYTHQARKMAMLIKDENKLAKANHNLSIYYRLKNNYADAFEYELEAIRYFEKSGNISSLINAYRSLGSAYRKQNKYDEALDILKKTLELCEKIDNRTDYSNTCHSIYLLYRELKDNENAMKYLELGMPKALPNSESMSNWILIKGTICNTNQEYDSALYYIRKSIQISPQKMVQNEYTICNTLYNIYFNLKNYDSAYYYANRVIKVAREKNNMEWMSYGYKSLSNINAAEEKFSEALKNYRLSVAYNDSVFNKENLDKIETLKIEYETEKKDAELVAINKQNESMNKTLRMRSLLLILAFSVIVLAVFYLISIQRSRKKIMEKNVEITQHRKDIDIQNQKLNEHVKTKDKFFSIISHDLRGPMGTQMSLIGALIERFEELSNPEKLEILNILKDSSTKSYDFMNNLLEWSRTQRGVIKSNPEIIDSKVIIDNVINVSNLRASQKGQLLANKVSIDTNVFADKNILNTIFNNLFNNAIKFTPEKDKIEVFAESKEDEVLFCVADSGIGIPQDKIEMIFRVDNDFKRSGTFEEHGTGLGLVIVKEFVNLMKGDVWVESEVGTGSKFFFTLPNKKPHTTTEI